MKRVALPLSLCAGLACILAASTRADEPDEDALRALVGRFYATQAARDVDALVALWDPAASDLPARRTALKKLFATYERIDVRDVRVAEVTVSGDTARVRASLELDVREPATGALAPGYGSLRRVFECVKRAGAWRVRREFAVEETLAQAVISAGSDEDRFALLAADEGYSRLELFRALAGTAESRQGQGKHDEALAILQLAQRLAERLESPVDAARVLSSLGSYHSLKGDPGPALESLQKALPLASAAGEPELEAAVLSKIGSAHARRGDYREAREAYERSFGLRETARHHAANVVTLGNLGNLALLEGDYETATRLQDQTLELAETVEDAPVVENTLNALGTIEHERGSYRRALAYYERSLAKAEAAGRKANQGTALNNIGLIQRLQGNPDLAREYLSRSLQVREALGDKAGIASTLLNLGMVERLQGNGEAALAFYERSLALREGAGDQAGAALAHNSIGLLAESGDRLDQALVYYRKSLEISERLGSRARSAQTLCNVAQVHQARGEHADALAVAGRAEALAREIGSQESLRSALTLTGRAHRSLGRHEEARRDLEEAAAVLEAMRNEAGGTAEEQQRFLESRVAPYEELAALAVERGDARAALAHSERAKARVLLDILQGGRVRVTRTMTDAEREQERALRARLQARNAQLRREQGRPSPDAARVRTLETERQQARFEHEAFETRLYAAHPELKSRRGQPALFADTDVETVLPGADSAAAVFLVTAERTYLFVLTRSAAEAHPQVYSLPVGRKALTDLVGDFRDRISRRDLAIRASARRLFDLLLSPARAQLAGKTALVIVPDGALWELPFQALRTAQGRYLIEDYAVSYAPSLTVLREMRRAHGRPAAAPNLLALGDPTQGDVPSGRRPRLMTGALGRLPEAEAQVRALGRLYGPGRSAVYWGAAAREERVKADAGRYRIVHFATHGVLDDRRPLYSYVALARSDGRETEDGLLEAWELMEMDLLADLVVLSACETGRGRFAAGEGIIGMTWAAFVAGSPATVASQWKVDAASTTALMVDFHRRLLRGSRPGGLAKAQALRYATLATMRDSRYRHPFYWAGFVVVGDPQ